MATPTAILLSAIDVVPCCCVSSRLVIFASCSKAHVWYQLYWPFLLASGIILGIFVGFECRHLKRRGFSKHFKSGWNRYEVLAYGAAMASVVTKLAYVLPHQEILDASALILLWIGIFNKIRGFEKFSVLITTFTQILYDIRYFTIMLAVLICAFAMAFKLLVRGQGLFDNFVAFESVYNLMFGLTELEFFTEDENNAISIAAKIFAMFFLFLVVIVMLNMLIAIMADSFDNVQENLKIQSFRAKARVCADLLIDFSPQHALFKQEYLHVCTVKDEAGENAMMSNQSQWEGRLKAVKREIKGVRDEMGSRMDGLEERLDGRVGGLEERLDGRISGLESKIDKILEALAKK